MTSDSLKKVVRDRYTPTMRPELEAQSAQEAIVRGTFSDQVKEQFFDQAFGEVLADLFMAWLKTEAHCVKEREFLYSTAMALGSVKGKLIDFSNLGKNTQFMQEQGKALPVLKGQNQEGTENADDGTDQ